MVGDSAHFTRAAVISHRFSSWRSPVKGEKRSIWRDSIGGKLNCPSLVWREKRGAGGVVEGRAQAGEEDKAQSVVEADHAAVESGVEQTVQRDAVADVEAFVLMAVPWQDVGGDEEVDWKS